MVYSFNIFLYWNHFERFFFLGTFCQEDYDGCKLASACKINWMNNTICNALNASEQVRQGHSYYCTGSCVSGYRSVDGYTCEGNI